MTDPQRCTAALDHLRGIWRLLEDAKVAGQYREVMVKLAENIKTSLGNKESDGMEGPHP